MEQATDAVKKLRLIANLVANQDGWANVINLMGNPVSDRTASKNLEYEPEVLSYGELLLRRRDPLCKAFVEKPAKAMLRRGVEVSTGDQALDSLVQKRFRDVKLVTSVRRAIEYGAAFGGGAVLLGFDDGLDPSMPARRGARLLWTRPLDSQELRVMSYQWNEDPLSAGYNTPLMWTAFLRNGRQLNVHPSRLLIVQGHVTCNLDTWHHQGWGHAPLATFAAVAADLVQALRSLKNLLSESSVGVLGIKDLVSLLAEDSASDGAKGLQVRAQSYYKQMRNGRLVIVDGENETFTRVNAAFQSMAECIDRLMVEVGQAGEMPVEVLFGRNPAGLNATGESTIRGWYDSLEGRQDEELHPHFYRVTGIILDAEAGGTYTEPYQVSFPPLWTMTEAEEADIDLKRAQELAIYLDHQVLAPPEVAEGVFGSEERRGKSIKLDREARRRSARRPMSAAGPPVVAPALPVPRET